MEYMDIKDKLKDIASRTIGTKDYYLARITNGKVSFPPVKLTLSQAAWQSQKPSVYAILVRLKGSSEVIGTVYLHD